MQNNHSGIIILPHVFSNHGLLDENSYPTGFAPGEFTLPDLYAVEVSKPLAQMSQNFQRLFRAGQDCMEVWRRSFPIATLMSSDCKQLVAVDANGNPLPNSIGYRYTWIKMSSPSIESLKQAFLDHDSRVSLDDKSPEDSNAHSRIVSIRIENSKFLEDQEVYLSPNLNCIIGGRGSGKSSLLEYLRLALRKDGEGELAGDSKTKERVERIKNTLQYEDNSSGKITIVWQGAEGVRETIVWENGTATPAEFQEDIATFFRGISASFFSQQQLTHMTAAEEYDDGKQQAQRLQDLIDGYFPNKMRELEREENAVRQQLLEAFGAQKHIKELEKELSQLRQEHATLIKQCNARQELQAPAQRHQLLNYERQRITALSASPFKELEQWLSDTAQKSEQRVSSLEASGKLESRLPHESQLLSADIFINKELANTARQIIAWVTDFNNKVNTYFSTESWHTIFSEINASDTEFQSKLAENGLNEADIQHLQVLLDSKKRAEENIESKRIALDEKKKSSPNLDILFNAIYAVWDKQYLTRKNAVEMANMHTSGGQASYKVIKVTVDYQADNKDFLEQWKQLAPSGRTKLGAEWAAIGNRVFETFIEQRLLPVGTDVQQQNEGVKSPWVVLNNALEAKDHATLRQWIGRTDSELPDVFISHFETEHAKWEKIRTSRIKDAVDLTLYRADSSPAGMMSNSTLSDGQRNTAALVLLLSQADTGPLVIDQPEEELDSEFIYNELLPLIREKKNTRQLIFSTHNANLPVNGDSELVYAFEARGNRGKCLSQGGTDRKDVADAILKIMEGSAEAFQRRKNKYHF